METTTMHPDQLQRALQATEQALQDCRARAEGAEQSGDAARAQLAKLNDLIRQATTGPDLDEALNAWMALREQALNQPGEHFYAVVEAGELERLRAIADEAAVWSVSTGPNAGFGLRVALDQWRS